MKGIYDFVVTPKDSEYTNIKTVEDKNLILNTELQTIITFHV